MFYTILQLVMFLLATGIVALLLYAWWLWNPQAFKQFWCKVGAFLKTVLSWAFSKIVLEVKNSTIRNNLTRAQQLYSPFEHIMAGALLDSARNFPIATVSGTYAQWEPLVRDDGIDVCRYTLMRQARATGEDIGFELCKDMYRIVDGALAGYYRANPQATRRVVLCDALLDSDNIYFDFQVIASTGATNYTKSIRERQRQRERAQQQAPTPKDKEF